MSAERLKSAAIIRDGVTHAAAKSHWEIRYRLEDAEPTAHKRGDEEGFMTSEGRFVDRDAAREVGMASGQLSPMWKRGGRQLLSSDIDWDSGQ